MKQRVHLTKGGCLATLRAKLAAQIEYAKASLATSHTEVHEIRYGDDYLIAQVIYK